MSLPTNTWDLNTPKKKIVKGVLSSGGNYPQEMMIRSLHAAVLQMENESSAINPDPGDLLALAISVKEIKANEISQYAGNSVVDYLLNQTGWRAEACTSMFIKVTAQVGHFHSWIKDPYEVPSSGNAIEEDFIRSSLYSDFFGILGKESVKPVPKQVIKVRFNDPANIESGLFLGIADAPYGRSSGMSEGESSEKSRKAFNNADTSVALAALNRT